MRTPQLLCSLLVVFATSACNRTDADRTAQRTADQVRSATTKAGHQLADSWLTTKIQAQYFADDDIKARHINVSTRDRVVTLTGVVDGQPQRELAVQIARTTDGVRQVNDHLTMASERPEKGAVATSGPPSPGSGAPPPPHAPDDAQITALVQSKFFVDDRIKDKQIQVESRNGVVILSGEVADEDERSQALLLARTTEGVTRVEDHLTVGPYSPPRATTPAAPPIGDEMMTTAIQARFFVDPLIKRSVVNVSTRDGVVQLQGTVASEAAKEQALAIAKNTEGVVQVVDRLRVTREAR